MSLGLPTPHVNNTYDDDAEYGLLRLQLQEVAAEASLSATYCDQCMTSQK